MVVAGVALVVMLPRIARVFAGPGPNPEVLLLALAHHGHDVKALTRRLKLAADGRTPENRTPARHHAIRCAEVPTTSILILLRSRSAAIL